MGEKKAHATGAALHGLFREVFALHAVLARVMDAVHEKAGWRTPHKRIAETLRRREAATVPDLAARLGVSRQFVQTACNELAAKGLLRFSENPRHKRSRLAVLTEHGSAALQHSSEMEHDIIAGGLSDVDPTVVDQSLELLRELRARISGVESEAWGGGGRHASTPAKRRTMRRDPLKRT